MVHQDPGERSSDLYKRLTQTCLRVSRSLQWRCGSEMAFLRARALSVAMRAWDLLKEVAVIFLTSIIVWSQVKQQGGNTAPPINRKLD